MRNLTFVAQILVRVTGVIQIVLGVLFWFGIATALIPVHILSGLIFVISMWLLGIVALRSRFNPPMAVVTLVYGLVMVVLGMIQTSILLGPSHWVVQVVHLLVGLGGMGLADRLSTGLLRTFVPGSGKVKPAATQP